MRHKLNSLHAANVSQDLSLVELSKRSGAKIQLSSQPAHVFQSPILQIVASDVTSVYGKKSSGIALPLASTVPTLTLGAFCCRYCRCYSHNVVRSSPKNFASCSGGWYGAGCTDPPRRDRKQVHCRYDLRRQHAGFHHSTRGQRHRPSISVFSGLRTKGGVSRRARLLSGQH